ncbi:carbohydrate kinase family protein [Labrys monachus]|uniref:Ribokinase n=1 Tax=Labrys monachus TaxID=217067 RepID=A0ABU0FLK6_9HYPH|nr:carbohydrate kinase family protein [Labrys monachus]MDQ0395371.1 ribokinase [Labrys monachus]
MNDTTSKNALPLFLCIGDIDVDILFGVDRLPVRDSKVNGRRLQRVPGGMAGNVSMGLARLGARVRLLGRVGDDEDGVFALQGLAGAGVDTGFVVRMAGVDTFSCIGLITPDGEKSLVKLMTPAYRPEADDIVPGVLAGVAHAHLTSGGDPALCERLVEAAHAAGATCSLDMERADLPKDGDEIRRAIRGFDLLFCNAESRAALDEALGRDLFGLVAQVVTTLGAEGSRVDGEGGAVQIPGFPAEVMDTTGAGDCFAAACLQARIVQGLDWPEALRFANGAASLSTTGYGAQSALPTQAEVESLLARTGR